jgi:hypothetical protein
MKSIYAFGLVLILSLTAGCASIYGVKHDYDQQVDFTKLSTYDWLVQSPNDVHSLNSQRVQKAVNARLQEKGLVLTSDNPDFLISHQLVSKDKVQINDWGYGYWPGWGHWGGYWGTSRITTYEYEEGSLVLNFVDPLSKRTIWQGIAKARIDHIKTPAQREALINGAVNEIMKNFPPPLPNQASE